MQIIKPHISTNIVITSVLLAIFVDIKFLNLIILAAMPSFSGIMTLMYAIVVIGIIYMGVLKKNRNFVSLTPTQIAITTLCFLWYILTSAFIGEPSVPLSLFSIFTLAAFIIPSIICIDVRIFLLTLFILPSVGIFYIDQIIIKSIIEENTLSMGKCYSMLVPVLACFVFLRFFFMKENIWKRLLLLPFMAINIFYLIQMVMFGSRSPILCVLLFIVSCFTVQISDNKQIHFRKGNIVLIFIGLIILGSLFIPILQAISVFFGNIDISLNVIDKILRLHEDGNILNGRDNISELALLGIYQSPILGHGLAQFQQNTGMVYPHNFLLQMLYDGGLFLTSCVLIPILKAGIHKIKNASADEFIYLIFLFFASVPGALFSGDLWQSVILWLFFGSLLSREKKLR